MATRDSDPEFTSGPARGWIRRALSLLWFAIAVTAGLAIAFVASWGQEAREDLGAASRGETAEAVLFSLLGFVIAAAGPFGAWYVRRTRVWLILTVIFGALLAVALFLGVIQILATDAVS